MSAVHFDLERFRQAVDAGPVLVDFWAPWCVHCRRLDPVFQEIAGDYAGRLQAGPVNIDDLPQLAAEYHVNVIPTLVLFRDGRAEASLTAPESKARIEAFLREHL